MPSNLGTLILMEDLVFFYSFLRNEDKGNVENFILFLSSLITRSNFIKIS